MTRQRPLGLGTHIFVTDADAAVAFYSEAFGAAELIRHRLPDGRVLFVELAVGPDKLEDVDSAFAHAVEMGATVEMPVAEMFWGERYGIVRDPFGHHWSLCTRRELLAPDEVADRVPPGPTDGTWTAR